MSVQDLLKTLIDEIATLARTETVVGDALQLGEHTVIPISRVSVGFGGGSGEGEGGDATRGQGKGTGGGGGGGVKVEPAAFIVVKGDELSILAAPGRKGALGDLFEHMPDLVSKIAAAQAGKAGKGGKGAGKTAAGEEPQEPDPAS
jgi:uncharacterized spore protein YtfJ